MKLLYWNIRGIANSPSRLALKRLLLQHKPELLFIAEPWMRYEAFPATWLYRLGFKVFSFNIRTNNTPNLWCICSLNLSPTIIHVDNQQVSFSLPINQQNFYFSAIYASNSNITRKQLWLTLSNLQNLHIGPWCFIGDFNTIIGAHEHQGYSNPARPPIIDFQHWTDSNNLFHIPTKGAVYTWDNCRSGRMHIKRRLDRAVCNHDLIDNCSSISCMTLIKHKSDHHPLLLDIKTEEHSFASSFKFMNMWSLHKDCRPLIEQCWNESVVGCPMMRLSTKLKNLKSKLKTWNKEVYGNIHEHVHSAETNLQLIQNLINTNGHTDALLNQEKEANVQLEEALKKQEIFWKDKARVNWHIHGDRNTRYFHRVTKIKNKTKIISSLRNGNDILTEPSSIADHMVSHYKCLFSANNVLQDSLLVEEVIPNLIDPQINTILTQIPTPEEIKHAVFDMNKDGAPGPDGFGAGFFQEYWEVINSDVIAATTQFFTTGWLLPGFNSNTIVLIPKNSNADTIDQYRPIALANFKFKIISKVLADRLASILPNIVSKEQRGFIRGRNIKDCISLTSEAINTLDKTCFGGNLALKIDVSKAFDTLDWGFLLKVLRGFGFNSTFCHWIETILRSAMISISINGSQQGYFACKRGVRQGDPLSPLLFCLAEEVLSRGISKLVDKGEMDLISSSRGCQVPSHCFYADDLMIFCKGKTSNLEALKCLFTRYANCSGQIINANKSFFFAGGVSQNRLGHFTNVLGFNVGTLPFTYLGAPIFKGKPKVVHFQPIADKVKNKLGTWKAALLSIAGRVQLVKSVIQSMLLHTMTIYSWPVSLLKDLEKCIRNFIWSGDSSKRKMVTVAWKKVCLDYEEGGLGVKSLISLNEATNLKCCWSLFNSSEEWASLLRSRVFRGSRCISHHVYSSIWSSVKPEFQTVLNNSNWLIGNGRQVNFWTDHWCGEPLAYLYQIPDVMVSLLPTKVCEYIDQFTWRISEDLEEFFPNLRNLVSQVTLPCFDTDDILAWNHTADGELSLKEAYRFKKHILVKLPWTKIVWNKDIPPAKSLMVWRLMLDKLPTDEKLSHRGLNLPSMCSLCKKNQETSFHLFFECIYSCNIWCWLSRMLNIPLIFQDIEDIWTTCDRFSNLQTKLVVNSAIINIINAIWFARNQFRFNNKKISWKSSIASISALVTLTGNNSKACSLSMTDFSILKKFNITFQPTRAPRIIEVIWHPPFDPWIKCNTDGCATLASSSYGGIFRNAGADVLMCFAENIGEGNAFLAELTGAMKAIEIAHQQGWNYLWLELDSAMVVHALKHNSQVPCKLRNRWRNCTQIIKNMNFIVSHVYREGNQCADGLANIGLTLDNYTTWNAIPSSLLSAFVLNKLGWPNFRFVPF